jgi:hypothetical protein
MTLRYISFWFLLAACLFAFIFFFQRHKTHPVASNPLMLPELRADAVTSVQVRGIRAERTNGTWHLTQPFIYPALATNVETLLKHLENLKPAAYVSPAELRGHPDADQEYGFLSPQASIILQQPDYRAQLLVGSLTTPGDQVFLQVVGREGIYVTDADWIKSLPKSANDWRDTVVIGPDTSIFDRIAVTNNSRAFVLQRETNKLWRMVWPLNYARADTSRVEEALDNLERLRVRQFVSEEASEIDAYGLTPPTLEISLGEGTNQFTVIQFGNNPATATNQVYARRLGQPSVFTVDNDLLSLWRNASINDFRDRHLLTLTEPVMAIDVRSDEPFSIQRDTNDTWQVLPGNFTADSLLLKELLSSLTNMQIQFVKDVVNPPDLPEFGLASPARKYTLKRSSNGSTSDDTNCVVGELDFGMVTNQPDKVYVRRAGANESSVYSVSTNDFAGLPSKNWQMRQRRLWTISMDDLAGVTIRQAGKSRGVVRRGPHRWSLAAGSQGVINDLAVEETVRGLIQASVVQWVARGEQNRERYGLAAARYQIDLNLKQGGKATVEFGAEAPSSNRYAGIAIDGQFYVFEFPWTLYRDISSYL